MIIVLLIHLRNLREYPKDNRHHSEEESKVLPQIIHALSEHGVDPSGVHMFSYGGGTAHRFRPVRQVSHFTPGQLRQLLSQQFVVRRCGGKIWTVSFPEHKSYRDGIWEQHYTCTWPHDSNFTFCSGSCCIIGDKSTFFSSVFATTRGRYPRTDPFNPLLQSVCSFSCSS